MRGWTPEVGRALVGVGGAHCGTPSVARPEDCGLPFALIFVLFGAFVVKRGLIDHEEREEHEAMGTKLCGQRVGEGTVNLLDCRFMLDQQAWP
jgi:hypothetical protein